MKRRCKKLTKGRKSSKDIQMTIVEVSNTDSPSPLQSEECSWEQLQEYYSDSKFKVEPVLSRTSLLLLDYRQFKAARMIQRVVRGWLVRNRLSKQQRAAIVLQREWRRFSACRFCFRYLENKVQCAVETHFNRCAVRIQSLWRGWWVREHIHNHGRLGRMQLYAAEDLLYCVAFKLHHLLRTHQIPGIYSIRNSNCLSKVEQLLAAMSFKQYNERARAARARRDTLIAGAKRAFGKSAHQTQLPYTGPNISSLCEPKCCDLYRTSDADKRMHRILNLYAETVCAESAPGARGKQSGAGKRKSMAQLNKSTVGDKEEGNFCVDIINSMKRWKILSKKDLSVDPEVVLKQPGNVESFLQEAQSLYSLIQGSCGCSYQPPEALARPYPPRLPCP